MVDLNIVEKYEMLVNLDWYVICFILNLLVFISEIEYDIWMLLINFLNFIFWDFSFFFKIIWFVFNLL